MLKLGVNIDHVATLRQVRSAKEPDPVKAAIIALDSGADGITAHLREDRRHIQEKDIRLLCRHTRPLNMEMAITKEMLSIACSLKPENCCLVPEKRMELTTEGGLDVLSDVEKVKKAVRRLKKAGITVSIFIDPDEKQIEAAASTGAPFIELHTGKFALADRNTQKTELKRLCRAAKFANSIGLNVNAGHGINYDNIDGILEIPHLVELNIGHSIIAMSIFVGIGKAVSLMKEKMKKYKNGR